MYSSKKPKLGFIKNGNNTSKYRQPVLDLLGRGTAMRRCVSPSQLR